MPDDSGQPDDPPERKPLDSTSADRRAGRRPRYAGTHPRRFEQRYKELDPERFPEMHEHIRQRGRTPAGTHVPILLPELLEVFAPQPGEIVCDATLGYGGHARGFIERIGPAGWFVGLDLDATQARETAERLGAAYLGECKTPLKTPSPESRCAVFHTNFAGVGKALGMLGLDGCDVLYADLGVSSMQIDNPQRGFSYKHDGPLDMRMDARLRRSAADLVNTLPEAEISAALRDLADEPLHGPIARAIVRRRSKNALAGTLELVELVRQATAAGEEWQSSAARVFQALRILVNDELGSLRELLRVAPYCLRPGGRIGVLSFHSGEDRLVKHALRDGQRAGIYEDGHDDIIIPSGDERRSNPRCASAKLRWARKSTSIPQS